MKKFKTSIGILIESIGMVISLIVVGSVIAAMFPVAVVSVLKEKYHERKGAIKPDEKS